MDASDFGRYLAQQRELRGMSREEVAQATKIPLALVGAIEEGEFQRLPGRVFAVNFIRSYAQVIGLEPDDAILRFEEAGGQVAAPQAATSPARGPATRGSPPPKPGLPRAAAGAALVLALVLVLLALLLVHRHAPGILHR